MTRIIYFLLLCAACFYAPATFAQDQINRAEYFYDTDPGVGNGIALSVSTPSESLLLTTSIPVPATLTPGIHYLYIRTFADSLGYAGRWSMAARKQVRVAAQISEAEYFLDVDPGAGNGVSIAITEGASVAATFPLTISTLMPPGLHYLYIRTKSSTDVWGLAQRQPYYVKNSLAAAEYFIDSDPGPGNGTPFTLPVDDTIVQTQSVTLPGDIAPGLHYLYARSRSSDGIWGLTQQTQFFVKNTIIAAEYFFDTDPGIGLGNPWPAAIATSDSLAGSASITLPCLLAGMHLLHVRTQDANGVWSLTNADTFYINAPALTVAGNFPGPGPYGTPVRVSASGGTGPYLYQLEGGSFSAEDLYLRPNGSATVFNATDTCGYSGSVTVNTPATPLNIATAATATVTLPLTGWKYWVYVLTESGDIIAAVKDNGQDLGLLSAAYLKHTGPVRQFPASWESMYYLDRNWEIHTEVAPQQPVGLRFYALNEEFDALDAAEVNISSLSDLRLIQYDGPNEDLTFSNNDLSVFGDVLTPDSMGSFAGSTTNGYWLDFVVNGFSEFYESRTPGVPLAVESLSLQAIADGRQVKLTWEAVNEKDLLNYTVQRSQDGQQWQDLGSVNAKNLSLAAYAFTDESPWQGLNLYRISVRDVANEISFSNIAKAVLKGNRSLVIAPNPAHDFLNVQGTSPDDQILLHDMTGREIYKAKANGEAIQISVATLPAGFYLLRIISIGGETYTQKITVQK